jgi:hypothetical protein
MNLGVEVGRGENSRTPWRAGIVRRSGPPSLLRVFGILGWGLLGILRFLPCVESSDCSTSSSGSYTSHVCHKRFIVPLEMLVTKDHIAFFLVVPPLCDADLSETPAIELTSERREFGFSKEEWKEPFHKLASTSDNEGVSILCPGDDAPSVLVLGLCILPVDMSEHQHELSRRKAMVRVMLNSRVSHFVPSDDIYFLWEIQCSTVLIHELQKVNAIELFKVAEAEKQQASD